MPFLLPYLELRRLGFSPRSLTETKRFSADVYAYFTADPNLRLWGPIASAWPGSRRRAVSRLDDRRPRRNWCGSAAGGAWRGGWTWPRLSGARRGAGLRPRLIRAAALHHRQLARSRRPAARLVDSPAGAARSPSSRARSSSRRSSPSRSRRVGSRARRRSPRGWRRRPAFFRSSRSSPSRCRSARRFTRKDERSPTRASTRSSRLRARLRRRARAGALRDDRHARPRGARRARVARRSNAAAGDASSCVAGALIVVEASGDADSDQREFHGVPRRQASRRCRRASRSATPRRRSIDTSRSFPTSPSSSSCRSASRRSTSVTCSIRPTHWKRLVNGYSGGAPLAYEFLDRGLRTSLTRPERAWEAVAASSATHAVVHEGSYAGRPRSPFRRLAPRARRTRSGVFRTDRVFASAFSESDRSRST